MYRHLSERLRTFPNGKMAWHLVEKYGSRYEVHVSKHHVYDLSVWLVGRGLASLG